MQLIFFQCRIRSSVGGCDLSAIIVVSVCAAVAVGVAVAVMTLVLLMLV